MKAKFLVLNESMVKLLNYRIELEEFSAWVYLSMSLWAMEKGFLEAGRVFKKFSEEELVLAFEVREILLTNGIEPTTIPIKRPKQEFESLSQVIKAAFDHENLINKQCCALTKAAYEEENYLVVQLGLWYCKEQIEEMDNCQNQINRSDPFGDSKDILRGLDEEIQKLIGQ